MAKKTIGEIINLVRNTKSDYEKVKVLRENDCRVLRELLQMNFDPSVQFDLPSGEIDFGATKLNPNAVTHLMPEWGRFKRVFLKGGKPIKEKTRMVNFVGLLKSLEPIEASIVLEVKDKKLSGITEEVVRKAFPNLLPSNAR